MPAKIRPTIIWGTDQAEACKAPPMTTNRFPRRIQLRLPSGIPIMTTASEHTVAARVYADAIIGITQGPVGCYTEIKSVCSSEVIGLIFFDLHFTHPHGISELRSILHSPEYASIVAIETE